MEKPILGISMGDPFGNGPEITVKALSHTRSSISRPSILGCCFPGKRVDA